MLGFIAEEYSRPRSHDHTQRVASNLLSNTSLLEGLCILNGNLNFALAKGSYQSMVKDPVTGEGAPSHLRVRESMEAGGHFSSNHYRSMSLRLLPLNRVIPDSCLRFLSTGRLHRILWGDPYTFQKCCGALLPYRSLRRIVYLMSVFQTCCPTVCLKDARELESIMQLGLVRLAAIRTQ